MQNMIVIQQYLGVVQWW